MNLINLAHLAALAASVVIPLVGSLIAKNRTVAGYLTPLLSIVAGLVTAWAAAPTGFAWGDALLTALVSYVIAIRAHERTWADSPLEARLLAIGPGKPARRSHAAK